MHTTMLTTALVFDLTPTDLAGIMDELHAYHAIFSPLFARREQRDWAATYLHGLLLDIPRMSIEPMVLHLRGADRNAVRTLQQFVSIGAWDDGPILTQLWREIAADLGDADGVLVVDGSDSPKQGKESVGVKRQYCGQLGKTANCQAGVFLAYASAHGYALLDRRLYLPEEWFSDAYAAPAPIHAPVAAPALTALLAHCHHADRLVPYEQALPHCGCCSSSESGHHGKTRMGILPHAIK